MIFTGKFEVPYFIVPLPEHLEIKESILKLIQEDESESNSDNGQNIYKTDYFMPDKPRTYFSIIQPHLLKLLKTLPSIVDYQNIVTQRTGMWYQQYRKLDHHCFHKHDAAWASVYYVELDEKSPGTQFKGFFTTENISPEVKEGDVIVFPGWLDHRSPPNLSSKRKTVIASNYFYSYQMKK